ncbi:ABC transporter permease subunit [Halobaculum sp. WSA2]|uniref:ABC transporter permease subunit n=1 Tax=Halobaculum saliterrae TaxID=2073113 RepID=A0A6B0SP61_9EURY|nr:ABC transporter permease [Halobaculum saliterrae]MXR40515.1 ABC transporter permease subunit [Halobaculum saliterrae]
MRRYVAKRVAHAAVVIYIVATIVFFAVRAIPGDPARVLLGGDASAEAIAALREDMGLTEPLYVQYFRWVSRIFQGDLGTSVFSDQSVLQMLMGVAEPTLSIAGLGMVIALLIAIPAGITSAVKRYQWEDYVATGVSFLGISMPGFWIGIVLLMVFADQLGVVPAFGYVSFRQGIIPWLEHIALPALAVGLPYGGILMRMTRSSMMEVLNEDYMRTARAKGLNGRLILFKHGLQNALIPIVTIAGILLGVLLGGVVAVEIVFGIQGLGRLLIASIERRDFPVIQGAVIVISFVFVFMNLFVDIMYTSINPRIKYGGGD